jgi:hypothetical protein
MVILKCAILYILKVSHNVDGVVVLQNCMDVLKSEPGSSIGTCQVSSDDDHFVGIKVEVVSDVKVEEDPGPATSTAIKTEPAVSCMSLCIQVYVHWTDQVHVCRTRCEWKI